MMREYQCQKCKKIVELSPDESCAPDIGEQVKVPYHCGLPMMEIID